MDYKILSIDDIKDEDILLIKEKMPKRFMKASKYKTKPAFLRTIGGALLILNNFDSFNEEDIYFNEFNKPYLKNNLYFNISHSGKYVVFTKSIKEVGIDIEIYNEKHLSIMDKVFQEDEIEYIKKDLIKRFYALWCMKESVIKALGFGFKLFPKSFNVLPFTNNQNIVINNKVISNETTIESKYIVSMSIVES